MTPTEQCFGALVRVESLAKAKMRVWTVPSSSRFGRCAMIRVSLSVHEPRVVDVSRSEYRGLTYILVA